jgi:integrase
VAKWVEKPDEAKWLRPEDLPKLLKAAGQLRARPRFYQFGFHMIADLGLRVVELLWIRVGDINLKEGTVSLQVAKQKRSEGESGKRPRWISHFTPDLLTKVKRRIEKEGLKKDDLLFSIQGWQPSKRAVQEQFKRAVKLAGLHERLSVHGLRHGYAVRVRRAAKGDYQVLRKMLRHKSIRSSQFYIHISDEEQKEVARKL